MKKIYLLLLAVILFAKISEAQTNISNYTFAASTGNTYTPITGGTAFIAAGVGYDNSVSSAITMGGTFPFGGVNMTTCYISTNGFITFGAAPGSTTYTPMSTIGSTTGAISAFGQDAGSSTATGAVPEIRYQNLGTEFVVQYTDHANFYNSATERLNFQIRLTYATGAINIIYGPCTNPGTVSASGTSVQVGIRGNSTTWGTNVNSLLIGNVPATTTCDWSNAVTGNANNSALLFSGTTNVNVKIPSGLMYTWTPGAQLPVTTYAAVAGITSTGATLSWTAPAGATQYNVRYRVPGTCGWTNFSGNPVSSPTATLTGLTPNTTYQIQVQASNGSANSIWSHIPTSASGSGLNGYTSTGTFTTLALACSGTPSGGTVAQPVYNLCTGSTAVLTVTGQTSGVTGLTYQWEQSADGVSGWAAATGGSGATTLSYTTPAYAGTPIYYRLTITCSGSGLSGSSTVAQVTNPAAPGTQASNFTAASITTSGATLSWTNGNGNNRSVFINTTNSFVDPTSPNTPGTASTTYSGSGQQLVYDGTSTSVTVSGLTSGTTYYVRVYEGQKCTSPAAWYYNISTAVNNPGNFATLTPPANDLVCNATNLVVDDPTPSCVNTTAATTSASDPDISGCSTPNNNVWYKFTPTVSGIHTITASVPAASTGGMSAWLFLYTVTGTCPAALTFTAAGGVSCTAGPSSSTAGTSTAVTTTALTAGTTYYLLIDGNLGSFGDVCVKVAGPQPMSYVSSTATQSVVSSVAQGTANTQILGLQVVTTGTLSPLTVTGINFNTNGTTLPADITQAKVYYTGASSTFATTTQFGTAYLNPNGTFSVTGSQALTGGASNTTNYFWLVYDVACNATVTDVLDAEVPSFNIGASNYIPTVTAPAGTRAISALYTPTRTDGNSTTAITVGAVNARMVYGLISGSAACGANVTKVDFTVSGTNAPVDINQAKCYYTTTTTFSTATPFGTAIANPAAGTISFTGSQALATGSNYFWMVYDINCAATVGNTVNGDVNTIYVNGNPVAVTGTATSANAIAAASSTFTTVTDGEWNSPSTWACGVIPPTNATAVTVANNITVSNAGNIAGSVTINSGASLTINSGGDLALGVTGGDNKTLTNNGTLSVTGGTLTQNGNVILSSGSTFNQSGGNFVVDGNGATSVASGTVLFLVNSGLGTVNGGMLTIVDPPATGSARSFAYSVSLTSASWAGHTIKFGNGVSTAASANANGFEFDTYVSSGELLLGNLIADGGNTANRWISTSSSSANSSDVGGNVTINAGSEIRNISAGIGLLVGGNIINNGTLTTNVAVYMGSLSGTSFVQSTAPQSISGTGVFRNSATTPTASMASLQVYNSNAAGVTLNVPITLSSTLTMSAGKINTTATNLLTVGVSGTTIGTISYTAGMVVGPIKKWFAATTGSSLLPVGNGTSYKPATINFTTAPTTAGTLTAIWSSAVPSFPNAAPLTEGSLVVNKVSKQGSWFIDAGDGLTGGTYTATVTGNGSTDVIDYTKTVLVKRPSTGGDWALVGTHVTTTGSNTAPVLSRTGVTGFSEFAIGGEATVALPIALEYFRGSKQAAGNVLDWRFSSSSTSVMTLERSTDRVNYKVINTQTATTSQMLSPFTYTDAAPEAGVNYYRLKITNADGESKYSNVVALVNKDKGFELISIAPNPVQHSTVLSLSSAKAGRIELSVSDVNGKVVMKQSVSVIAGNNPITLNLSALAAGTYQISAINADGDSKSARFMKF